MPETKIVGWKCRHCGHTWKPRRGSSSGGRPVVCPNPKCGKLKP